MHGKGYGFPLPGSSKEAGSDAAAWERSGSARDNSGSDLTTAARCKQASEHKNAKQQSNAIMHALLSTVKVELGCGELSVANWQR